MRFFCLLITLFLCACSSNMIDSKDTPAIQQIAECQTSDEVAALENKINAEYGFKRFAKNTYRPVIERRIIGHELLIINIEKTKNKLYVSGSPLEMAEHFSHYLSNMSCDNDQNCQATINDKQTLKIYRAKVKQARNVTVLECNKI